MENLQEAIETRLKTSLIGTSQEIGSQDLNLDQTTGLHRIGIFPGEVI
jgi:hypothetical protein